MKRPDRNLLDFFTLSLFFMNSSRYNLDICNNLINSKRLAILNISPSADIWFLPYDITTRQNSR